MKQVRDGQSWGDWKLHVDNLTLLIHRGDGQTYAVELEMIRDSASMLDWIFQVRSKSRATNKITGDLLAAFHDIFDPQVPKTIQDALTGADRKHFARLKSAVPQRVD
jgi:hypothetical protein